MSIENYVRIHNLLASPQIDNQALMLGFVPSGHPSLDDLHIVAMYKFPVDDNHQEIVQVYSAEALDDYMYLAVRDYLKHAPFLEGLDVH